MSASQTSPDSIDLVSIIIPTYNYLAFLENAVASALAQTHSNVEVIVVDDGSTDGTCEAMKSYDDRVRYVYQENEGLAAARNTGIRNANGAYVVFLDADDVLLPEMVAVTMERLSSLPETYALVASRSERMTAGGDRMDERLRDAVDRDISTLDLLVSSRFGCAVLARKRAIEECGLFDTDLPASEDRDMWIRLSMSLRLHFLGRTLFRVRRHSDNMSYDGRRQSEAIAQVLWKARKAGALRGWRRIFWLKAKSYFHYQSGLMLSAKQPGKAFLNLVLSILAWPVHGDRLVLGQPRLFRTRAIARLLLGSGG